MLKKLFTFFFLFNDFLILYVKVGVELGGCFFKTTNKKFGLGRIVIGMLKDLILDLVFDRNEQPTKFYDYL